MDRNEAIERIVQRRPRRGSRSGIDFVLFKKLGTWRSTKIDLLMHAAAASSCTVPSLAAGVVTKSM